MEKLLKRPKNKITRDSKATRRMFAFWQPTIFIMMYLLYFVSYLGRKSISIGFNGSDGAAVQLGLPKTLFSELMMIYYAMYMIGKFLGGIIADKTNVRISLPIAMGLSSVFSAGIGIAGYLYGTSALGSIESVKMFMSVSWAITAFIQALTFPMCAKMLVNWYPNKKRPYVWSLFSTSHEVGSAFSYSLAAFLLQSSGWGWQSVFTIPAMLGVSASLIGFFLLRDNPKDMGLPDVEQYSGNKDKAIDANNDSSEAPDNRTYWQVLVEEIFKSRVIWILSLAYICTYILRAGTADYLSKMYMEGAGALPIASAIPTTILSLCGMLGTLSVTFVSDKIFKSRRAPAVLCYFLLVFLCVIGFRCIFPYGGSAIIKLSEPLNTIFACILMGLTGIGIYGPQVMVGGIAAIEAGSKRVAGTISGFVGAMGYIGSIISSYIGKLAGSKFEILNNAWIISALLGIVLMIFIFNTKATKQYSVEE